MLLYNVHTWYGHLLQLVPMLVVAFFLLRRGQPVQRIAPVLLDINVAIGLLLWLLDRPSVSIWHPILMFAAIGIAHGVSRSRNRGVVIGAWIGVLALVVISIQIAGGNIRI
ncbi:pilus assembly protein [Deinococcus yavapaiensis]|uniref:Uncharacterized protein n=1 Tax=Deinococcus yavapaiensis KR-236 TaxID=694435 RepID=A0A318SN84_9DEIO|nr:pilus assembly protein [Deinococcus yavapaiensis]PYE56352.1 hypothetical protein DES52_101156 [Deinococcus yavapaiensis KR-236]